MRGRLRQGLAMAAIGASAAAIAMALRPRANIQLAGKAALITGGSRGLGLLLAREFAEREARVAVCARDEGELARIRREFAYLGQNFMALQCDVSNREEVEKLIETVEEEWGRIDILVNNAGIITVAPLENLSVSDFEDAIQINLFGAVYASLAALPGMRRHRSGRILNISSIGGKIAVPHLLPYTMSKFALTGFSQGLSTEVAKDGIRVTTVYPGLMRTGSPRNVGVKGRHQLEYAWFMLADSFPATSISARRAAKSIVDACVNGRKEVVLGLPAKFAAAAQALAPGIVNGLMAATNKWLLPSASQADTGEKKGFESESRVTRSGLTSLTRSAEIANNQVQNIRD